MKIRPFDVEMWMNAYETGCRLNLAETCVASITLQELIELSGRNTDALQDILSIKLTYGAIEGADRLRDAISALYKDQSRDNIVTTHGTIGANALVYKTLVEPGDHVISIAPSYQQHISLPESIGAEVTPLYLREEDGFRPDLDALGEVLRPNTKLISLTNPNNPTGALMEEHDLRAMVAQIQDSNTWILCDEVYRGTAQTGTEIGPAIADIYERGISTAGMSKAFSLAGLRLGWITAPKAMIEKIMIHRDYDTISVGQLDEYFATLALEAKDALLARSRNITRTNLAILDDWVSTEPHISYVKPKAATICLLKYDMETGSHSLAEDILSETGVLLTPGSAFDIEGYLRIGFANQTEVLRQGLAALSGYLRRYD